MKRFLFDHLIAGDRETPWSGRNLPLTEPSDQTLTEHRATGRRASPTPRVLTEPRPSPRPPCCNVYSSFDPPLMRKNSTQAFRRPEDCSQSKFRSEPGAGLHCSAKKPIELPMRLYNYASTSIINYTSTSIISRAAGRFLQALRLPRARAKKLPR
jgi:hypothetical protein